MDTEEVREELEASLNLFTSGKGSSLSELSSKFIESDHPFTAFEVLKDSLSQHLVASELLEKFVLRQRISATIADLPADLDRRSLSSLASALVNLPTLLANATRGASKLTADQNVKLLLDAVVAEPVKWPLFRLVLEKLAMSGFSELFWKHALPLAPASHWFTDLSTSALDKFVWTLLRSDNCTIELLCTAVPQTLFTSSPRIRHLFTSTLLLGRHSDRVSVPLILLVYLRSVGCDLEKLLLTLLSVWCDRPTTQRLPLEHDRYHSRALVVCFACLDDDQRARVRSEVMQTLLTGVTSRLDASPEWARYHGMLVARLLTDALAVGEDAPRLEFEIPENEETAIMRSLLEPDKLLREITDSVASKLTKEKVLEKEEVKNNDSKKKLSPKPELDSDDDLEPYEINDDEYLTDETAKRPKYLRQCLLGLTSNDQITVEQSLIACPQLIRSSTHLLDELAVELTRILLQVGLDDADSMRHRIQALVALAVGAPVKVTAALGAAFYEPNYTVSQRLDVLEVFTQAAEELSNPSSSSGSSATSTARTSTGDASPHYSEIIAQRLEAKTRRFHSAAPADTYPSRFASVACNFFYPLLVHFDRRTPQLDLLGRDHAVLARLLHTLALVVYAGRSAPRAPQLARSLMELVVRLRFHSADAVRRATLFALCMSVVALTADRSGGSMTLLVGDLASAELANWLEDAELNETDAQCHHLAAEARALLRSSLITTG